MAGTLKREAADMAEELTLMRALRDMNMPKFGKFKIQNKNKNKFKIKIKIILFLNKL
jgi:hypothetical protein